MSSDIDGYSVYQDDEHFKKNVEKLPMVVQEVLREKIKFLAENPYHNSLNTKQYYCSTEKKKALIKSGIDDVREFYINRKKYRCIFYVFHQHKMLYLAFVGLHADLENKYGR